jgi:hypothetical protein
MWGLQMPGFMRWLPLRLPKFLPVYLRHLVAQPYRRGGTAGPGLGTRALRRHRIALYDGVLNLVMDGYAELTGQAVRRSAGRMVVLLTRVAFAFDDEFEQRTAAGKPHGFTDVMGSDAVQEHLDHWHTFMHADPCYPAIREFLTDCVAELHATYLTGTERSGTPARDFSTAMRGAELDSGGLLTILAHVLALYHGTAAVPSAVLAQFSRLGVAGKIADDMTDLRKDFDAGRLNLLQEIAAGNGGEWDIALRAIRTPGVRLSANWWLRNCPQSFSDFVLICKENYDPLTSRSLRLAWQLIWMPAYFGHSLEKETRGRL